MKKLNLESKMNSFFRNKNFRKGAQLKAVLLLFAIFSLTSEVEAQFGPPQAAYTDIIINEIHYNPSDSLVWNPMTNMYDTIDGKNYEFIELKNTGPVAVCLKDVQLEHGDTTIITDNACIPSGGFFIMVEDSSRFHELYGFAPDLVYNGKLSNGGESIILRTPAGVIFDSLTYDDVDPWTPDADRGVLSLALKNDSLDNSDPDNWGIQSIPTTPGAENYFENVHQTSQIVINEIHYHPDDSINGAIIIDDDVFEFIEIKNTSSSPVDLSGAFFSKGIDYTFPPGTIIAPNGFLVFAHDELFFILRYNKAPTGVYDGKLRNSGENVWLHNRYGTLLDAVDYDVVGEWDSIPDGSPYSLALINANTENNYGPNWTIQPTEVTPCAENFFGNLPLGLKSFSVKEFECVPSLAWSIYWEKNTSHTEVYRKSNKDIGFEKIATIPLAGNSERETNYQFEDANIPLGANYIEYQLKFIDLDNSHTFSNVRIAKPKCSSEFSFVLYPNPSSGKVTMQFAGLEKDAIFSCELFDLKGKIVRSFELLSYEKAAFEVETNFSSLERGVYLLRIKESRGKAFSQLLELF